jgi:hypothetical protein
MNTTEKKRKFLRSYNLSSPNTGSAPFGDASRGMLPLRGRCRDAARAQARFARNARQLRKGFAGPAAEPIRWAAFIIKIDILTKIYL